MDRAQVATRIAELLTARRQTLAIAESSAGGLISAALLALPGASAFFLGGAVVYTAAARAGLLDIHPVDLTGMRPATEAYARLLAERTSKRLGADWALAETGATGPTGNRYGDPAGHACLALAGPRTTLTRRIRTGSADRAANMAAFTDTALAWLAEVLAETAAD